MTDVLMAIMRPAQVAQHLGIHRVTLYKWIERGDFPKPAKIGRNTVAWRADVVQEWLDAKFAPVEAQ